MMGIPIEGRTNVKCDSMLVAHTIQLESMMLENNSNEIACHFER
jgi:hypothetical protein